MKPMFSMIFALPVSQSNRRASRVNRGPLRNAGIRSRRSFKLSMERLEQRAVPTILFMPQSFGTETATNHGGPELQDVEVQLVFWGSYWTSSQGQADQARDMSLANSLVGTPYFSGLAEYYTNHEAPTVSINPSADLVTITTAPTSATPDTTLTNGVLTLVNQDLASGQLPTPTAFGNATTVYVVVTPPGCVDSASNAEGGGQLNGWNANDSAVVLPDSPAGQFTNASVIWCRDMPTSDEFSCVLGQQLADIMTDPQGATGVTVGSTPDHSQIGDNEATNLAYRLDGLLVQPYWSQSTGAYIIPDGNTDDVGYSVPFEISGGSHSAFSEGTGSTLTVYIDPFFVDRFSEGDIFAVDRSSSGALTITMANGEETDRFDPEVISSIQIVPYPNGYSPPYYSLDAGNLELDITGDWSDPVGWQVPTITLDKERYCCPGYADASNTTINITPAAGGLIFLPHTLLDVVGAPEDPVTTTININDQADTQGYHWTFSSGVVYVGDQALVTCTAVKPYLDPPRALLVS